MTTKKFTIKDIAKLAGVSKGTVDRVLHKRGKVSKKAQDKVDSIIKEIDYQPNPMARSLKENKVYKISVLIPDMEVDPYWIPAHEGIRDAANQYRSFGLIVEQFNYHPKQKDSFIQKSKEALATSPDVLLLAPLFQEESLLTQAQCKEQNVRVAFFNNYLSTINQDLFIGQDLSQSGRIAADLIYKTVGDAAEIVIIHIDLEPHMQFKENGFKNYFNRKKNSNIQLSTKNFTTDDEMLFEKEVCNFFQNHPTISAIFITNSKVFMLVPILQKQNYNGIIIGYDLLQQNIKCLKSNKIDFLLHQRPKRQAYLGVNYFAELFLFGKKSPNQKFLPIDICSAENVDYYIN